MQLTGEVAEICIVKKTLTASFHEDFKHRDNIKNVIEWFNTKHKDFGEPIAGHVVTNSGSEYQCRGQFEVTRPRACRLVVNLVGQNAGVAQPNGEEGEDGEESDGAVESSDGDDDDSSVHIKQCNLCRSTGPEGMKCEAGSECDSEAGGYYVDDVDSDADGDYDDDSDDSSQFQERRCGVCGHTGPQGLKCYYGDECNEDTGGWYSEPL